MNIFQRLSVWVLGLFRPTVDKTVVRYSARYLYLKDQMLAARAEGDEELEDWLLDQMDAEWEYMQRPPQSDV